MKSITEVLGSLQLLLPLDFDLPKRYFKIVATSDLRARLLSDAKIIYQFVLDRGRIPNSLI